MITENEIVEQLVESVTVKVTAVIQENLSSLVQHEISRALAKSLGEGRYYRGLSDDVVDSVHNMFEEITSIKKSLVDATDDSSGALSETDHILESIVKSSEESTLKIIDYLEQMQDLVAVIRSSCSDSPISADEKFDQLEDLLMQSMTELSFQDLGGQKIKRVVQFLRRMEEMVSEAYMTAEIFRKSKEKAPQKDVETIRDDAKTVIESARENKNVIDQSDVDALLADMGL